MIFQIDHVLEFFAYSVFNLLVQLWNRFEAIFGCIDQIDALEFVCVGKGKRIQIWIFIKRFWG